MVGRTDRRRQRVLLLSLPLALSLVLGDISPADAQQRPRNLLEMLFGPPVGVQQQQQQQQRVQPQPQVRRQPERRQRAQGERRGNTRQQAAKPRRQQAPATPAVAAVEKSENARDVLVVGDFMAASLARGLTEALADNRDVRIVGHPEGSSGLVREDYYNWIEQLPRLMEETKPDLVVVMLGSNDRQALRVGGTSEPVRSGSWTEEYRRRAQTLAELVESREVPLVWVGMPAFQSARMSEDMVFLNDIYKSAAASASGQFVDVWSGFVDASGNFITSGPDPEGQPSRLRNSDGITMTAAGAAKLAYYVKEPVVSRLGLSVGDMLMSLAPQQVPEGALPAIRRGTDSVRTEPIALNDPGLSGSDALLGGAAGGAADTALSPRDRLVVAGTPPAAADGRADSFNWSGRGAAVSPLTRDNAIVSRGSVSLDSLRAGEAAPIATPPAAPSPIDPAEPALP